MLCIILGRVGLIRLCLIYRVEMFLIMNCKIEFILIILNRLYSLCIYNFRNCLICDQINYDVIGCCFVVNFFVVVEWLFKSYCGVMM